MEVLRSNGESHIVFEKFKNAENLNLFLIAEAALLCRVIIATGNKSE